MRDENQRRDSLQLPSQIRPLGCDRVTRQIQYLPRSKIFISDTTLSIFKAKEYFSVFINERVIDSNKIKEISRHTL